MKVEIHIESVRETVEAPDARALLSHVKRLAAQKAPFLVRAVINGMSDMKFAGEAVARANKSSGQNDGPPGSPEEFLRWAEKRGYVTIVEP